MKSIALLALFLGLGTVATRGQVDVILELEQKQFLRNESIPVKVQINNHSGQPLKIGESADWLTFTVENRQGQAVPAVQELVAGGQFDLESAGSVSKTIDIGPAYDLSQPGSYRIVATAKFNALNLVASSQPQPFDIVAGSRLWEEVCGVPTTNGAPRYIRYTLLQSFRGKELRLAVRIAEEPDAPGARLVPLGPVVSFAQPDHVIDRGSVLHLLYQSGPHGYDYVELAPEGEITTRKAFQLAPPRPRLKLGEDGRVTILGGMPKTPVVGPPLTNAPPATPKKKSK
jgi:hypothetical protein